MVQKRGALLSNALSSIYYIKLSYIIRLLIEYRNNLLLHISAQYDRRVIEKGERHRQRFIFILFHRFLLPMLKRRSTASVTAFAAATAFLGTSMRTHRFRNTKKRVIPIAQVLVCSCSLTMRRMFFLFLKFVLFKDVWYPAWVAECDPYP